MDHLLHPKNGVPMDDIPVLEPALNLYDGLGLEGFRNRYYPLDEHPGPHQPIVHAFFVQGWLYFGLLKEFFGNQFQVENFVRTVSPHVHSNNSTSQQQRVLSTAELPMLIKQHIKRIKTPFRKFHVDIKSELLSFVVNECSRIDQLDTQFEGPLPEILLSIRILVQTLQQDFTNTVEGLFEKNIPIRFDWQDRLSLRPIKHRWGDQERAWCSHQVRHLIQTFTYHTLIYLAELRREVPEWVNHSDCSQHHHCVAYNIDTNTFCGRHIDDCQGCAHVEAPLDQMMSILETGGIPLLKCQLSVDVPHSPIQLSYVRVDSSTPYQAVSHVWSDGLGTPSQNSLPECQLRSVVAKLRVSHDYRSQNGRLSSRNWRRTRPTNEVLLWLDVYCVPASGQDERRDALKSIAIDRMVPTYALASQTLVLDHELQRYAPETIDARKATMDEEVLARIAISVWRSRCWTHQEEKLSRRIFVQLAGSGVFFDADPNILLLAPRSLLCCELQRFSPGRVYIPYRREWVRSGTSLPKIHATALHLNIDTTLSRPRFVSSWNALFGKTTSHPADALQIFATTMRFRVLLIRSLPAEGQMRAIIRATIENEGALPASLFFSSMPRIHASSSPSGEDRWLPLIPGEGAKMEERDGVVMPISGGFLMRLGAGHHRLGIRVSRPNTTRFIVPFTGMLFDISLCVGDLPPKIDADNTDLVLVLTIPSGDALFEGNGACLLPQGSGPGSTRPSGREMSALDTTWYCALRYKTLDKSYSTQLNNTPMMEIATLPQPSGTGNIIIRYGEYLYLQGLLMS
ncbi:putative conserved hypothetical protein [Rosellinia necatrix]|uniref:Heterokaryon incompatibility domain-containing protein n=1 Tax=Rosellinia necatrix TaxID=77044 RepID=A0A1S8A9H1_ROSNE|nr:putative conserved hypothetical protein [Rosellinia necatrix]